MNDTQVNANDHKIIKELKSEIRYCLDEKYLPSILQIHWVGTYLDPSFKSFFFVSDHSYLETQKKEVRKGLHILASDIIQQFDSSHSSQSQHVSSTSPSPSSKRFKNDPFADFHVSRLGIDLLTICSHKFHGPKGIGALYIRQGIKLESIVYGAQHEQGLRPGTENVLSIIGLGKACQLISNKSILNKRIEQMKRTRDKLYQGLINKFNHNNDQDLIIRNGNEQCLPNTLSLTFHGINAKKLVNQLSNQLAFSTGSACHEDNQHQSISTTLQAIAHSTVRLNTSYMTTDDEIDQAIVIITNADRQQLSSSLIS
ncbi:unnamed protein product [Rotaria sp. Silwood2]|nr:unnamed protein product [Rotaria sp. Silwood2]CAF4641588.1 unnamed protein product [Rotaria sp. Silwood2]